MKPANSSPKLASCGERGGCAITNSRAMPAKNSPPTSFSTSPGNARSQRLDEAGHYVVAVDRKARAPGRRRYVPQLQPERQVPHRAARPQTMPRRLRAWSLSCRRRARAAGQDIPGRGGLGAQHRPCRHVIVPFDQGRNGAGAGEHVAVQLPDLGGDRRAMRCRSAARAPESSASSSCPPRWISLTRSSGNRSR